MYVTSPGFAVGMDASNSGTRATSNGVFNDAALAAEVQGLGIGATLEARFNRAEDHPFSASIARIQL